MDEVNTLAAPLIEARALEKFYTQPDGVRVQVISPTNLAIYPGQILTLPGPSGCGKSTLLRMLTGLAEPSAGSFLAYGFAPAADFSGAGVSVGFSPQMYCANHFSFSSITARCCFGLLIPCPKPLYTTIFTGTPLSSSASRNSYALGIGTRRSFSPCWMSVGVFALAM